MNKEQVVELLDFISLNYSNFKFDDRVVNSWYEELQQYDLDDIKDRLKSLMSEEKYQSQPPLLGMIARGVTKKYDKVNFNELIYPCQLCKRYFNSHEELIEHEDRCRSVRYIQKQYQRFKLGNIDKRFLYELSDEEFDTRYKKLLRIVQQRTNDEREKTIIEFIFNPPSAIKAKNFLKEN